VPGLDGYRRCALSRPVSLPNARQLCCQEFIDDLANLEDTPAKKQVIAHLRKTQFIVSCQLLSDCDNDGFEANGQFLDYFVDHCGAMIHAGGEGFYERMDLGKILLPLK
jgi:hypothetical protein